MKLKNVVTGTLVSALLVLSGCGGGGGKGDPVNVAEQFMDRYYVQANVQEAKALAIPAVAQQIDAALGSPAGDAPGDKGGNREVSYTLKEKNKEGKHAYAVYKITIKRKEADPLYKTTSLSIDVVDGAWKITQFDEKTESGPHQETTK